MPDYLSTAMLLRGLQPPDRWGGDQATEFVAAIGFPALYSRLSRRESASPSF